MLYAKSTGGFYTKDIHEPACIPGDAIAISDALYASLMDAQSQGKVIQAGDDGMPIAVDRPPAPVDIELMRQAAYRVESDPLFFKYQRGEATKDEWLAAVNDIKARYQK